MALSAYWHGLHPGLYLTFLWIPFIVKAEDGMINSFRHGDKIRKEIFDWLCWFFKMRGFEYLVMGVMLQRLDYTLTYWKSIYFIGHVITFIFLGCGTLFQSKRPNDRKLE